MQKTIKTASRRSKPPCSRRDEFLKRDRQLSLSGHPRQSKLGKRIAPSQTKRKRPRKDNAVHVSLPSDAIVKQRGNRSPTFRSRNPTPRLYRSEEASASHVAIDLELAGPKTTKPHRPASQQVGGSIVRHWKPR